jgi:hypothetical protein
VSQIEYAPLTKLSFNAGDNILAFHNTGVVRVRR